MPNSKMIALGEHRSVIRDLFEYGMERKKIVGEDNVFDFSIGNPSIPAPEAVGKELVRLIEETPPTALHGYSSAAGDPAVRRAVADYISKTFGVNETPDDVYMTCGAAASLTISLHALLNEGDEVIVFAPFFPEYRVFIEKAGGVVKVVPAQGEDFAPDLDAFARTLSEKTRAVIVNSPNNPSGAVLSEETLNAIAGMMKKQSRLSGAPVWLIADEPYRELVYDGVTVPYPMRFYTDTLVCYSFSKSLSLPGERIGYIALCHEAEDRDRVFAAICGAGRALGFVCAPVLFQKMIPALLGQTADVSAYRKNRDLLYSSLVSYGYTCVRPRGAFYLFLKAPDGDDAAFGETCRKRDLLIVPAAGFGTPGWLRVSYCVSEKTIRGALPVFEKIAKEYGLK